MHNLAQKLGDPTTAFVVEVSGGVVTGVSFPDNQVQKFVIVDYDELEDSLPTVAAVDAIVDLVHAKFPEARYA